MTKQEFDRKQCQMQTEFLNRQYALKKERAYQGGY